MSQLSKDIGEALPNNPVWASTIRAQIEEAKRDYPDASVAVSIFAPSAGIFTLFFATSKENGILYVPSYSLNVINNENIVRAYIGELASADKKVYDAASFLEVLKKYYSGNVGFLTLSMTWGGYEAQDIDILEDLGLVYTSFRCDAASEERQFFRIVNGRWKPVEQIIPFGLFNDYLERNKDILRTIFFKIAPRIGPMSDGSSSDKMLEPLVDIDNIARRKYYEGAPEQCDLCLIPLGDETFISDGRIDGKATWANMCADCTVYHGAGIEWGTGQLYRKEPDGRWLQVAGGPPPSEDENMSD